MNKIERIKMIKAMEFVARQINDEEVLEGWLVNGVADGDIEYGDISVMSDNEETLDYYMENTHFADLMDTFLWVMAKAKKSGGLYTDAVISKAEV